MEEKSLSVKERLASLETLTKTRWDSHDKRSDENWQKVNETLKEITTFMLNEGERKEGCMKEAKDHAERHTNKTVSLALGIPATVCGIIALFIMVVRLWKSN